MKLDNLNEAAFKALDDAAGGVFSSVQEVCGENGYEAHLTVQTYHEGLEKGEMKLYIQVVGGGETKDFAIARIGRPLQPIGWDIYLHDRIESARGHLVSANARLSNLESYH